MLTKKYLELGTSLVEVILAMSIVAVVITAVVSLTIVSLNSSGANDDENQATNYAQEGIEIMRDIKSSNYQVFLDIIDGSRCLPANSTTPSSTICASSSSYNIGGEFTRLIYIDDRGIDARPSSPVQVCGSASDPVPLVVSVVYWKDSKCSANDNCHSVELSTCFINDGELPLL